MKMIKKGDIVYVRELSIEEEREVDRDHGFYLGMKKYYNVKGICTASNSYGTHIKYPDGSVYTWNTKFIKMPCSIVLPNELFEVV